LASLGARDGKDAGEPKIAFIACVPSPPEKERLLEVTSSVASRSPTPCVTRAGARIGDRRGQGRQQTQLTVRGLEQDRAAVRARVWLIKGRDQRPIGQLRFIPPNSA
jgi:hypothetical protein